MWLTEDSPDLMRRSYLTLVTARLCTFLADVISEISFLDEFFNLILEHNALLCDVVDILVIPTIFILILL